MKQLRNSIDGFVPRRGGGSSSSARPRQAAAGVKAAVSRPELRTASSSTAKQPHVEKDSLRNDLSSSLDSIEGLDAIDSSSKKGRSKKPVSKSKAKRIIKWLIILIILALLGIGGWVAYKAFTASNNVFQGSILDIVKNQPLKQDANGRSNILVFGTSEDDPGHKGAALTDSIMVISIDQTKKNAFMISIPRDLYVDYGASCPEGYKGKINSLYDCFAGDGNIADGANALKAKAGDILGLDVQYFAYLNYTAVRQAVDAVGGVDVTIESTDPRGILDRNFDWKCNYKCYYVNYKNGEVAHMDGEHALAFSRARNASGGYGLPGQNFDREKNQQKVIKALREKAVSAGTLSNINSVTGLIDALGNNLRTNFETKEIRTLVDIGNQIKTESIQSVSFVEEGNMLMTTGSVGTASIVKPIAGLMDYSAIQNYVHKVLNANDITREAAKVVVLNGSGVAGLAQQDADKLTGKGFTISAVDNAPQGAYEPIEIYQIGTGMEKTKAALASEYKVAIKTTAPPLSVAEGTNFVIVIGKGRASQ